MSYLVLNVVLAIWVFVNAQKRGASALPYTLWALGVGVLAVPFYLAKRPLLDGETREGGTAWNVCRYFAILWTFAMIWVGIAGIINIGSSFKPSMNEYETAGTAIGTAIGMGFIGMLWFFGVVGALALGLILKKSSVVEVGPTQPPRVGNGWTIAAVAMLALIILGNFAGNSNTAASTASTASALPAFSASEPEKEKLDLFGDWAYKRGEYGTLYIVGEMRNTTNETLGYGQVTFTLHDKSGAQIGTAMDNTTNIAPGGRWKFKAIVSDDENLESARLSEVSAF